MIMATEYQICKRCVMDTTDPDINFDENGYCNHCTNAIKKLENVRFSSEEERKNKLEQIVNNIKRKGKGKKYDCIIGLSGGVDSSYLAYIVKHLGLRPLAVHVDNGWNSELAVMNIENIVKKLNIDLFSYVIDWEEFKDLQKAYLKASVVDLEVLSDNAIVIAIHQLLRKNKIKHFLIGFNHASESIMPSAWYYSNKYDSKNIISIYKQYGNGKKLKSYPLLSLRGYIMYRFFDKSRKINILDYIQYDKKNAIEILKNELSWRDYGGKHNESIITKFYQNYILPKKFKIDKRRAHLSSLICSKQMSRESALNELQKKPYTEKEIEDDIAYFIKKLGITHDEFWSIMKKPIRSHFEFKSYVILRKKIGEILRLSKKD
jgi:N-acetyl sugar amidotransferase